MCLDVARQKRKSLLLLALSLSVMVWYQACNLWSIDKLYCHTVHLREAPFVLRKLISQVESISAPGKASRQGPDRDMCGLHCRLRVCPQGFSNMNTLFWLHKPSLQFQLGRRVQTRDPQQIPRPQREPLTLHESATPQWATTTHKIKDPVHGFKDLYACCEIWEL